MLVEMAIADAYGAGFEAHPGQPKNHNDGRSYWQHPYHLELQPGMYTDDTQMSIAVARCMLNQNTSRDAFAESFVATFKADPREGYAPGFQQFLKTVRNGGEFLQTILPHSEKSGAAMRAGPIGLYPDIVEVLAVSDRQARLTHDTKTGRISAQAAALLVHHQAYRLGPLTNLPQFLSHWLSGADWYTPWVGPTGDMGLDIVRAAVTLLGQAQSLTDLLMRCADLGGDTDTLATIAMAAASVSSLPNDLDPILKTRLDPPPGFGVAVLEHLDQDLAQAFPCPAFGTP